MVFEPEIVLGALRPHVYTWVSHYCPQGYEIDWDSTSLLNIYSFSIWDKEKALTHAVFQHYSVDCIAPLCNMITFFQASKVFFFFPLFI